MRDHNRYVTKKYTTDWYDIGIELGLELDTLDIIENNNSKSSETCFRKTLDMWLKANIDATWKTLETALTNVNRAKLGMEPVDSVHGKEKIAVRVYRRHKTVSSYSMILVSYFKTT